MVVMGLTKIMVFWVSILYLEASKIGAEKLIDILDRYGILKRWELWENDYAF